MRTLCGKILDLMEEDDWFTIPMDTASFVDDLQWYTH